MKNIYFLFLTLLYSNLQFAQTYPGGVTGSEVWINGIQTEFVSGTLVNHSQTNIVVESCNIDVDEALFNFNPSITTENLCAEYPAPLENSTGRSIFFVGEPEDTNEAYSNVATGWKGNVSITFPPPFIRNFFNYNETNLGAWEIVTGYSSLNNAHINFYHSNHYNIDKKFKSYGEEGETSFLIGKMTQFTFSDPPTLLDDYHYSGNFPEYISFPRELSLNERNRVESYLALKYGLTLYTSESYKNSKNIVFWNASNNALFSHRIFGFGKDDVSGLNQLQSESTHLKDYLVGAVGEILATNTQKQDSVTIPNTHFLVFGDTNGSDNISHSSDKGIRFWDKTWLAQRTGAVTDTLPIHFKLKLTNELWEYLASDPSLYAWLMKDNYRSNDEVSDFSGEYIEYYKGEVDINNGYAYFSDVYFDPDENVYDQFTFGVGPEIILQAQVAGCSGTTPTVTIDISGGSPDYDIDVESSQGTFSDTTSTNTYTFNIVAGVTYEVTVTDSNGGVATIEFTANPWNFSLDLGPDQQLSQSNPEIILDASTGITDPNATYKWYKDGNLLTETESTLTVDEPGTYSAVVTSADLSCEVSDDIIITYENFFIEVTEVIEGCDEFHNSFTLEVNGGFSPYSTTLSGPNGLTNFVHSSDLTLSDLPYGTYTATTTDSEDNTDMDTFSIVEPTVIDFGIDIYTQLEAYCDIGVPCVNYTYPVAPYFTPPTSVTNFTIDASIGVTHPNLTYQWYLDNEPLNYTGPIFNLSYGMPCDYRSNPLFTVIVTDVVTNCSMSQSFITKNPCDQGGGSLKDESTEDATTLGGDSLQKDTLITKVYPNPTEANTTFIFELLSTKTFQGVVEIFTIHGALIYTKEIQGASTYKIPFYLNTSGTYIIRTTAQDNTVITNRVIIK